MSNMMRALVKARPEVGLWPENEFPDTLNVSVPVGDQPVTPN